MKFQVFLTIDDNLDNLDILERFKEKNKYMVVQIGDLYMSYVEGDDHWLVRNENGGKFGAIKWDVVENNIVFGILWPEQIDAQKVYESILEYAVQQIVEGL